MNENQKSPVNVTVNDGKVKKSKVNKDLLNVFTSGIFKENAVFVMLLGLCPVFIATQSINNAIGMSFCFLFVLFFSNLIISLLRKVIPSEIRVPVYIVIIASLVTIVSLLLQAFAYTLYNSLGTFIPLITVNCIILGRAESFASKNNVGRSCLDALGIGIGFAFALIVLAFFRELFGTGGINLSNPFTGKALYPKWTPLEAIALPILTTNQGGFMVFGIVVGVYTTIMMFIAEQKKKKEIKAKQKLIAAKKQEGAK